MALTKQAFTPATGFKDATAYPNPTSGVQARTQLMTPHEQMQTYVNSTLTVEVDASLALKADDSAVVHDTGDETIAGIKTFSSSPIVPTPTTATQAATKKYVDDTVVAVSVPDNSLGEIKMANEMKKMAGGVAPYDDVIFESGGTFTGTVSHGRNLVQQPKIKDYSEALTTNATANGTVSLDLSTANVFNETLTNTTTFTFDNPAATGQAHSFTLILNQGGTAYSVTWPTSVKWSNDTIPVISDINKTCIFSFITVNGGTRWYGTAVTKLTT